MKKNEILVRNLRVRDLADQLPDEVFPVDVAVGMSRHQKKDTHLADRGGNPIRKPAYPFNVRLAAETPYISGSVVDFHNPYKFPRSAEKAWNFEEFSERLTAAADAIEDIDPRGGSRIYFKRLRLCELPPQYVEWEEDGSRNVDYEMYQDRVEFTVSTFAQRPKVSEKKVREDLGESAPGHIMKPLKLTEMQVVTAKEFRGSHETSAVQTRYKVFTEGQAEQYNDLSLAPTTIQRTDSWDAFENYNPTLAAATDSDDRYFVDLVEFEGELSESEEFDEKRAVIATPRA